MDEVTFRSITPILDFAFERADNQFLHSGNYRTATYTVSLKGYDRTKAGFDELMEGADEWAREQLAPRYTRVDATNHYLVVDVTQPIGDELRVPGNTFESVHIPSVMIESLHLHSSKGLLFEQMYQFRLHHSDAWFTSRPMPSQYVFPHQGFPGQSVLSDSEFESCRETFNTLLQKEWNDEFPFDRLLKMAVEYHKAACNSPAVEHSFLILMVVFEALFKKKQESGARQAAMRIASLLSEARNDQQRIHSAFFDNDPHSFCSIRNAIAHGDPDLNLRTVKSRYPLLYQYVSRAIVRLLMIQDGTVDHTNDYYDEISRFIDQRFAALPVS